jgi:hypothetical protein
MCFIVLDNAYTSAVGHSIKCDISIANVEGGAVLTDDNIVQFEKML